MDEVNITCLTHLTNSMKFCVNFPTNCSYPTKGSTWNAGNAWKCMEILCSFQSDGYFSFSVPKRRQRGLGEAEGHDWSGGPEQLSIDSHKG